MPILDPPAQPLPPERLPPEPPPEPPPAVHPRRLPFCERYFGPFFILWGVVLILDHYFHLAARGLFYNHLDHYLPGWAWSAVLITIGATRLYAAWYRHTALRIHLSGATFVLLTVVAAIAWYTGLWAATAPLASFVAVVAYWCHSALLRDLRHGL